MSRKHWRGYSSYGKSALGVSINLNGLDEYLAKIEAAGNNIDDACKDAVNAALPIVEKAMVQGADRHAREDRTVVNAIESVPAKQEGNYIYGEVKVNTEKHPDAMHAVFQEYGDGHSPCFPDPFVRPAFDEHKPEIRKAERDVLKKAGVPVK